ncbi:MAG: sugar nucleotide-binding protein, partial [Leptolyngbyaceae cyanobacterium SL_5_9]|nr:sugar nucleotide-binding protein [Leptolyngbyaceae cyanobacterium SL_5_9]
VFHCAYDFSGQPQQRQQVNANGTENVAKAALKHGTRMIHISTIDVYGWPAEGKLDESFARQPEGNIYAETKLEGEAIASTITKNTAYLSPFFSLQLSTVPSLAPGQSTR